MGILTKNTPRFNHFEIIEFENTNIINPTKIKLPPIHPHFHARISPVKKLKMQP